MLRMIADEMQPQQVIAARGQAKGTRRAARSCQIRNGEPESAGISPKNAYCCLSNFRVLRSGTLGVHSTSFISDTILCFRRLFNVGRLSD